MSLTYWIAPGRTKCFDAQTTIDFVCELKNLDIKDVLGKSRKRPLADARFLIYYILKKHTDMTKLAIGNAVGNRDHSTVIHGLTAFQNRLDTEPGFKQLVDRIESKIV